MEKCTSLLSTSVKLCSYSLSVLKDIGTSVILMLGRRHFGTSCKAFSKNDRFGCWGGGKNTDLGHKEEKELENAQVSVVEPTLEPPEKWSSGQLAWCALFELSSSQIRLTNVNISCVLYHTSCLSGPLQHNLLDSHKKDQQRGRTGCNKID